MSTSAALLIVVPPGEDARFAATPVLGLPLIRRTVLAAGRAGVSPIWVLLDDNDNASERPALREALDGTAAQAVTPAQIASRDGSPDPSLRVFLASPRVILQRAWFREGLERRFEPGRVLLDNSGHAAVLDLEDVKGTLSQRFLTVPGDWATAEVALSSLAASPGGFLQRAEASQDVFAIRTPPDVRNAERWLLGSLIKDTEGFMSRHVERRISLAISRRLCWTRVTPNQMTLISVAIGLVGAAFFVCPRPAWQLCGALLFLLHSILDGCDGELARLKFQESRFGGVLDFWGDNVVHAAVFLGIAVGWSRALGSLWPLGLGAVAILGTFLSAGFVYATTMQSKGDGPLFTSVATAAGSTRLSAAADALARRDFIYLVVLLSAFGKAHWFLALAAAGAPIFFIVLLWIARRARPMGRKLS